MSRSDEDDEVLEEPLPLPPLELLSLLLWEWRCEEDELEEEYLDEDDDECLLLPSEWDDEDDFEPLC